MKREYLLIIIVLVIIGVVFLYTFIKPQKNQNQPPLNTPTTQENPSPSPVTNSISNGASPSIPLQLPQNFTIHLFASNLGSPRVLVFSPGGTLLVSNPNGNNVYALPDKNSDGVADENKIIISNENHVHGLSFYKGYLYIADVDKVVRYNWDESTLTATLDKVLFALPKNNDHNNRTIIFNNTGKMFVSVGSTCNVCAETPQTGGSLWISDENGTAPQIFATGLRNAAFMVINPKTNEIWATEMGRDNLGDNIPPDEINIIKKGFDYGWPYCFGNKVHDNSFDPSSTHSCKDTETPIYEVPAHSAPLGLRFIDSKQFPSNWQGDLLVAYHGSWNRSIPTGYKILHLKVSGNTITSSQDFLTGFAPETTSNVPGNINNSASGRPVDLLFDSLGNLYMSDDKGGNVYIIQSIVR